MSTQLLTKLKKAQILTAHQIEQLENHLKQHQNSLVDAITTLELLTSDCLASHIAAIYDLPYVNIHHFDYTKVYDTDNLVTLIIRHTALPVKTLKQRICLAVSDPSNPELEKEFRFTSGKDIQLVIASHEQISTVIDKLYGMQTKPRAITTPPDFTVHNIPLTKEQQKSSLIDYLKQENTDTPLHQYMQNLIVHALDRGASDIHVEPFEHSYRVRIRCDGVLIETDKPTREFSHRLTSRLKILAKLDIAECRLPQDGKISFQLDSNETVNIRISTLPTICGEKVVLRIFPAQAKELGIQTLGLSIEQKKRFKKTLAKTQGLILVTGPTGSGKTTTLYAALSQINTSSVNISTIEEPVEVNIPGINQVPIRPQRGMTFSSTLRALLRQDPDVMMIGEVRDQETAKLVVQAAQTGHLVLSTLHTNSALESIQRLQSLGVKPIDIAYSMSLIIAQRLVRKLCEYCKIMQQDIIEVQLENPLKSHTILYTANESGCQYCHLGYSGRTAIYEFIHFDRAIRDAIIQNASPSEVELCVKNSSISSLKASALVTLQRGTTSYSELTRLFDF